MTCSWTNEMVHGCNVIKHAQRCWLVLEASSRDWNVYFEYGDAHRSAFFRPQPEQVIVRYRLENKLSCSVEQITFTLACLWTKEEQKKKRKGRRLRLSHVCKKGMSLREFHSLMSGRLLVSVFGWLMDCVWHSRICGIWFITRKSIVLARRFTNESSCDDWT